MISAQTGEILFSNGKVLRADMPLPPLVLRESTPREVDGRVVVPLGLWHAEHGPFVVETVTDLDLRLRAVLLCHWRGLYRVRAEGDPQRGAFHELVINADLGGQREFAWGVVNNRLDTTQNRNWIVVMYSTGPQVPLLPPAVFGPMYAHATEESAPADSCVVTA